MAEDFIANKELRASLPTGNGCRIVNVC